VVTEGLDAAWPCSQAKWRRCRKYGNWSSGPDACDFQRFSSLAQEVAIDRIGRVTLADFQRQRVESIGSSYSAA